MSFGSQEDTLMHVLVPKRALQCTYLSQEGILAHFGPQGSTIINVILISFILSSPTWQVPL